MRWTFILFFAAVSVAACGAGGKAAQPASAPPAAPNVQASVTATDGSPEAVTAVLTGTSSLHAAGEQLAGALGVEPDRVRVRVKDDGCIVCGIHQRPELTSLDGLALDQAVAVIQADMTFWLFVDDLVCEYTLVGDVYTPHVCRRSPL